MGDCDSSGPTGASPICQCAVPDPSLIMGLGPDQTAKQEAIAYK